MSKRFKVLVLVMLISFVLHLCCFFSIEFDFSGGSFKYSPEVFFWGQLLDEADFLALRPENNFSGQGKNKNDKILYSRQGLNLAYLEETGSHLEKLNFRGQKKPHLIYDGLKTKEIVFVSQDRQKSKNFSQKSEIAKQNLANPFFYKELPAPAVEAELKTLADGRVLLIKRVKSSGDLEVDLFVLRVIRRRLYLEGKKADAPLKRIRVLLNND